jgi:hypothetical protein
MSEIARQFRIVLLIGSTLVFSTACDKKGETDKPASGASAGVPAAAPAAAPIPAEPFVVTPQALVQQFLDNPAAARTKYPRLTPFKVSGVVSGFGIDTLKIKDEDKPDRYTVTCTFTDSDQAKIKHAKRGDAFTIIGKFNTFDAEDKVVELISCKIAP